MPRTGRLVLPRTPRDKENKSFLFFSSIAEAGEKKYLQEGDDRYSPKGRRQSLPIDAWIIYRRDKPFQASLAGLSRDLVDHLPSVD